MARIYEQAYFGQGVVPMGEATLSIASSAVLYGLSVYTVFPVNKTPRGLGVFRLSNHFKRLIDSARIIGLDTFERDWSEEAFLEAVKETISANSIANDVFVRATVHVSDRLPGTRSHGLDTTLSIFLYEPVPILPQDGVRLKTSVWRRIPDYSIPSRAKVNGAYVNSVLARQDALDSGYDDCVFLDVNGHVCELSAANIFLVRDGQLVTPGVSSDILEGINRRTLLQLAADLKIPTIERNVDLTELYVADEVFACGTSSFVASVAEIDTRTIGTGSAGALTLKLRDLHNQVLHGENAEYLDWLTLIG